MANYRKATGPRFFRVDDSENYMTIIEEEEGNPNDFPAKKYFYMNRDPNADWKWLKKDNPYPGDKIKSQATFLGYMHNVVNPQYRTRRIYYPGIGDTLYYV